MTPIALTLTNAGLAALASASGGGPAVTLAEVGLTAQLFVAAPTLVALPGEFVRLPVSGKSVSANIAHMVAQDASAATWTARGIGLYTAGGTLFGVYRHVDAANDNVLLTKAAPATMLSALDLIFRSGEATLIQFGPVTFLYPPATETEKGVAAIATQALTDAGDDDQRIVTSKKLKARLDAVVTSLGARIDALSASVDTRIAAFTADVNGRIAAFVSSVNASLAAFAQRSITGVGMAIGGGTLEASRTIDVRKATGADVEAGTADDRAVTPLSLSSTSRSLVANGYERCANGTIEMWGTVAPFASSETSLSVSFPIQFPNGCLNVVVGSAIGAASSGADGWVQLIQNSPTATGFSVQAQSMGASWGVPIGFTWRAKGR